MMSYLERPWLKFYPKNIPHEVEVPEVSMTSLIDKAIRAHGSEVALIYLGTKITYSDLGRYIENLASALSKQGIKKSSVVAIYLPNCPQFVMAYYAIQKLGAIPTAVSFLYTNREIKLQLSNSGAESIIMLDLMYEKMKPLLNELCINKVMLVSMMHFLSPVKRAIGSLLGKVQKPSIPAGEPVLYLDKMLEMPSTGYPEVEISPRDDAASIVYTAGTTGLPKGITITHYNVVASMTITDAASGDLYKSRDTQYLLAYLPFFHVYGQIVLMTGGLSMGKTLIVIPNPKFEEMLKLIDKYRIAVFFGVPASFSIMIKYIKSGKFKLNSLRMCSCGSDKLPKNVSEEFKKLTGVDITEGYGLTEACGGVAGPAIGQEVRYDTLGTPLPSTLIAIASPDKDEFVPIGEQGEILVHGPQVMKEVWKDPERTAKYFATIGGKKWLRTGDLGYMDPDGYLHFVERLKEVIKYKGFQVFPKELEKIISEHPAVAEVAVIGIDTPRDYQIIKAFIVLKEGFKGTKKEEITEWCSRSLAPYKIPKEIEFMESLPKNRMGKVMRESLRERENGLRKGNNSPPPGSA